MGLLDVETEMAPEKTVRNSRAWSPEHDVELEGYEIHLGKKTLLASWQAYPAMAVDADFAAKVKAQLGSAKGPLYLICRSGARSRAAAIALTEAGLGPCFNVAGGFEGDKDAANHRGKTGGWKVAGLPWVQD